MLKFTRARQGADRDTPECTDPCHENSPQSRRRSIATVVLCCLGVIGEGFEIQIPGVTVAILTKQFDLSTGNGLWSGFLSNRSLFLSLGTFGLMIGAILGGWLADRLGRKWVAIISITAFGIMSIVTAHATSLETLLACRFLTGIGLGGALPTLMALAGEAVGPERRGAVVGFLTGCLPLGSVFASLFSIPFVNETQWPVIYYMGGAIPLVAAIGLVLIVRDQGSPTRAITPRAHGTLAALFGDGRRELTLGLWVGYTAMTTVSYVLIAWLPSLLMSNGLTTSQALLVQGGLMGFGMVGSIVTGYLVDSRHKKLGALSAFAISLMAILALPIVPSSFVLLFITGALVGFGLSGIGVVFFALTLRSYPADLRARALGFVIALGRLGATIGPLLAGAMLGGGASVGTVLAALVPLVILSTMASLYVSVRVSRG